MLKKDAKKKMQRKDAKKRCKEKMQRKDAKKSFSFFYLLKKNMQKRCRKCTQTKIKNGSLCTEHRQRERKRVQKPGALRILNFISVFL